MGERAYVFAGIKLVFGGEGKGERPETTQWGVGCADCWYCTYNIFIVIKKGMHQFRCIPLNRY